MRRNRQFTCIFCGKCFEAPALTAKFCGGRCFGKYTSAKVSRGPITQPIDADYRLIPLTQGKVAIVDSEDFDRLMQWNWVASFSPKTKTFYATTRVEQRTIQMHRFIKGLGVGPNKVDHRDGDTLNNRKINLRTCTDAENLRNQKLRRTNKSGFKGVSWNRGKWAATIMVNYKSIGLGRYTSPKEAANAYDQAAKRYFKDFARLNSHQLCTAEQSKDV